MADALRRAADRSALNHLSLQTHLDTLPPTTAAQDGHDAVGQGGDAPDASPG